MKDIYYAVISNTIGDTICATPTLKKLYDAYQRKINLVSRTDTKRVWINNPYINKIYTFEEFKSKFSGDFSKINYHESYVLPGLYNQFGMQRKFNMVDLRQVHANDIGIQLLPEEMTCEFYPNPFSNSFTLPKNYVVIHPSTNWPNRTWAIENWQKLVDYLSEKNIYTVVTGKNMVQSEPGITTKKSIEPLNNLYGLDLTDKADLSDTWYLLNNARMLITFDSGLLHLAGTTDTFILQLGSAKNPKFVIPYRKGSQNYKYSYIKGKCDLFCTSNLMYSGKGRDDINSIPLLVGCLENKPTFECHSSIEDVIKTVNYLFDNNIV